MVVENEAVRRALTGIRAIALDVDGVLTDGGFWWGTDGEELKRFCFADVMGLSLARRAGIVLALVSGENTPLVDRYASKLHINHVVKGCRDKAAALRQISNDTGIDLAGFCFMGDDINDLAPMRIAGVSAAPSNAAPMVIRESKLVTERPGGNGAVRELIETLFAAQGLQVEDVFARS